MSGDQVSTPTLSEQGLDLKKLTQAEYSQLADIVNSFRIDPTKALLPVVRDYGTTITSAELVEIKRTLSNRGTSDDLATLARLTALRCLSR